MKITQRITACLLCLSIAVNIGLVYTCIKNNNGIAYSHSRLSNIYEENLNLLATKSNEIEQNLSKLNVCTDCDQAIKILSDIIDDACAASSAMSVLPLSPEYMTVINRYFNHLSDYSRFMLYSSAKGELPTSAYGDNISALYKSANGINSAISSLCTNSENTAYDWSLYLEKEIAELDMLSDDLFGTVEAIQTESIDYPTLIYDGPFSDSVVNKIINETENKNIDEKEAERLFVNYLSVNGSYRLAGCDSCDGKISTWCVEIETDGKTYYGNVSKKTGKIISFLCDNNAKIQKYSRDDAIKTGTAFLISHGYESMEAQYCEVTENIATVNYVYKEDGILIYPDMVKIRVNLENCKVEGFEGLSYYANHHDRNLDTSKTTLSTSKLPQNCTITAQNTALIPTDGAGEQLCIEIRCIINNENYILYFDKETLKEIKIFKVLSNENGDFVI